MKVPPFFQISIYKLTAIFVVLIAVLDINAVSESIIERTLSPVCKWILSTKTDCLYASWTPYLFVMFFLVWFIVYFVERSFGLTMSAFRIRSRAGVAKWLDVIILVVTIIIIFAATSDQVMPQLKRFGSDDTTFFSQYLLVFSVLSILAALQSLSPWGEYRFDRRNVNETSQTKSAISVSSPTQTSGLISSTNVDVLSEPITVDPTIESSELPKPSTSLPFYKRIGRKKSTKNEVHDPIIQTVSDLVHGQRTDEIPRPASENDSQQT